MLKKLPGKAERYIDTVTGETYSRRGYDNLKAKKEGFKNSYRKNKARNAVLVTQYTIKGSKHETHFLDPDGDLKEQILYLFTLNTTASGIFVTLTYQNDDGTQSTKSTNVTRNGEIDIQVKYINDLRGKYGFDDLDVWTLIEVIATFIERA